ncbi:hypothetical protein PanWU01x14_209860 [Parasponia andersonii]|uniref:Uncharacterized protein n=1 Tax=Parasponia andersonii TaxID=3476 RepID=A0A2P5BUC0_PARAD|nr:hypothetical protein PanWU01x14_209860 [Parasponia andersonii]
MAYDLGTGPTMAKSITCSLETNHRNLVIVIGRHQPRKGVHTAKEELKWEEVAKITRKCHGAHCLYGTLRCASQCLEMQKTTWTVVVSSSGGREERNLVSMSGQRELSMPVVAVGRRAQFLGSFDDVGGLG